MHRLEMDSTHSQRAIGRELRQSSYRQFSSRVSMEVAKFASISYALIQLRYFPKGEIARNMKQRKPKFASIKDWKRYVGLATQQPIVDKSRQ